MIRTLLRDEVNQFRVVEDPSAISEIVMHKDRLLWLDLERPTASELATLQEEFGLHPLAIEDATMRHQRPKVDQYSNFYLVIFYSVGVEKPGAPGTLQGRRGLRGATFHRPQTPQPGRQAQAPDEATVTFEGVDSPRRGRGSESAIAERLTGEASEIAPSDERIVLRELSLFMGENYLITVHEYPVPELDEAARRWRQNAEEIAAEHSLLEDLPGTRPLSPREHTQLKMPGKNGGASGSVESPAPHSDGVGILLYSLLDSIVDSYFPVIDSLVERVEDLEEAIFERFTPESIQSIFVLKKDLLALRRVLAPERDVLNVLIRRDLPIFDSHTIVYFQDVYDHVVRITDSIDTYRDLLSSALDSYLSMQSNRLNITVQTLTSVSIILMSIAAVTGWFGMNFAAMPELTAWWGYPGVMVVVATVVVLEVIFFKRKKWL